MKKMKFLTALLVFALIFTLTACGGGGGGEDTGGGDDAVVVETGGGDDVVEPVAESTTFTIGYTFPTINNEFWGKSLQNLQAAEQALGFDLTYVACENDQAKQIADVEGMISAGIDGLVLAPQDASVCPGIIADCDAAGIPVIVIDRWPGDDLVAGEDYIAFIGPDDLNAGYGIAMSLIDGGCKNIVGIGGFQNTSVAEGRKAGLDKALAENPDITLLQYEWAGESMEVGDATLRNMMQAHGNIDGVWCYNDSLALASVNVLKEAGKIGDVKVGGMDLLDPAVNSMAAGELWFSTGGHYMQAAFAAIVVFDVLNGIPYAGDAVIKIKLFNVSQENLDQFIAKYVDNQIGRASCRERV